VLLILLFISGYIFKGKEKSGIFGGFYCFFKCAFEKAVFLVRSNYMNPEVNYGLLIDFLSQISKLSYFNVIA